MFAALVAVAAIVAGLGPLRQVAVRVGEAAGPAARDALVGLLPEHALSEVAVALVAALGPALVALGVLVAATVLRGIGRVVALVAVAGGIVGLGAAAGSPAAALVVLPLLGVIGASVTFARFAAAAAAGLLGAGWALTLGESSRSGGDALAAALDFDAAGTFTVAVVAAGVAVWSAAAGLLLRGA